MSLKERTPRRMNLLLVGLFSCARKQSRFLVLFLQLLCRSERPRPPKAGILNTRNVLGWLDTLTPFNLLFIFKHIDYCFLTSYFDLSGRHGFLELSHTGSEHTHHPT